MPKPGPFSFDDPQPQTETAPHDNSEPATGPAGPAGPAPDLALGPDPADTPGNPASASPTDLPGAAPGPTTLAPGAFPGTDASGETWDPARHAASGAKTATGHWRARRGTGAGPRASGPRTSSATPQGSQGALSVAELRAFLASIHGFAAMVTKVPELSLSADDANNLAVPLAEVAALYNIPVTKEMKAYAMLGMACVYVYGAKATAISTRLKRERANRAQRPPSAGPTAPPPETSTGDGFFTMPSIVSQPVADPNKPIIQAKEL